MDRVGALVPIATHGAAQYSIPRPPDPDPGIPVACTRRAAVQDSQRHSNNLAEVNFDGKNE